MGTAPVDGTTNTTLKIGGAWKGPNAASGFPFNVIQSTLTTAAGDFPRVNFMNDATYSITAAISHTNGGPILFQGFSATYGDGGKATIDGGTSGASYILLTVNGSWCPVIDMIFQNNGATGSANGLAISATGDDLVRVVINNVRGSGANNGTTTTFIECEAYACNQSNTSNLAGFTANDRGAHFLRCIAHDNTGSNVDGFNFSAGAMFVNCIADTNGRDGFNDNGNTPSYLINCDAYNNGRDGIRASSNGAATGGYIENCNLILNTGWGINGNVTTPTSVQLKLVNNGYGSGTQANTSGTSNLTNSSTETGAVTYASNVTPWVAPATGNFSINLQAAVQAGRGTFTETQASYTGSASYPDIGAGQCRVPLVTIGIQGVM